MPRGHRNGIVRGYYLKYYKVEPKGHENISSVIGNTSVELTGLDRYCNYSIQVKAFTIEEGNFSESIVVSSGEDGKVY